MVAGQFTVIGSRTGTDDYRYQMDVTSEGAVPVSGTVGITGSIVIGSVSAHVDSIYVASGNNIEGSMFILGQPVSVNATQSTNPWIVLGSANVTNADASNLNAQVVGEIAHDSADSGNPLKGGGKAIDYTPDTDAEQGASEVTANDRVNQAFNLRGETIEGVNARYNVLDNVSDTYDDVTSTATSTAIDCWNYRYATLGFELDIANTPTDIVFEVWVSIDGTNYVKIMNDFLGDWRYDDTAVGAGIEEGLTFYLPGNKIRIKVTATGTTAVNTFTVANACLYLSN